MYAQLELIPGGNDYERRLEEVYYLIRRDYPAACEQVERYIENPEPTGCSSEFWQNIAELLTKSTWKPKRELLQRLFELSYQRAKERRPYEYAA